jgi:uncharacterized membrane protein YfcA
MLLEIATCSGALAGAAFASRVPTAVLAILLGVVLLFSAFAPTPKDELKPQPEDPHSLAARFALDGEYPSPQGPVHYTVKRVPLGFGIMTIAGLLSGLLGIGSGAVKVLAMDLAMGLPFKVSTTTSNFMIGVTAAASAGVYLSHGFIEPRLAMPVMLGVLGGALAGTRVLVHAHVRTLRIVFGVVILALAIEMIVNGINGRI